MPLPLHLCAVCAGVAAVAWWIAARYPRIGPRTKTAVAAWVAAAIGATWIASRAFAPVMAVGGPTLGFILIVLPSGICVMLTATWTTRFVGERVGLRR